MTVNVGDIVGVRVMQILPGKYRIRWTGKAGPDWFLLPVEAVVEINVDEQKQEGTEE